MFTIRTDPEPFLTYYRLIDLLTQRRKALKMTQEELGKHCQISMGAISNIEKRKKAAKLITIIKMADVLGYAAVIRPKTHR